MSGKKIWCFYSYTSALIDYKIDEHAQIQMKKLGIEVYDSIPQSVGDGWEFLIDYYSVLPGYITKRGNHER